MSANHLRFGAALLAALSLAGAAAAQQGAVELKTRVESGCS